MSPQTEGTILLEAPEPIAGTIVVSSDPVGAEVYIDGKYQGTTPGSFNTIIGTHKVSVKYQGFMPYEETVNIISEGQRIGIQAKMENKFPVHISSTPGATLFFDGVCVGKTTWSSYATPGQHVVKLEPELSFYHTDSTHVPFFTASTI